MSQQVGEHVVAEHVTHIGSITNDFIFDLFPSLETLLDQDLRTQTERFGTQVPQFLLVVCETGSETSKRER